VITGLVGLKPIDANQFDLHPLAPESWDWFALDDVPYQGRLVSLLWDKKGTRYGRGTGLTILVDGKPVLNRPDLKPIRLALPPLPKVAPRQPTDAQTNFAANNDGTYYPKVSASYTSPGSSLGKVNDGNYWYHIHPPNRWTCEGSPQASDWLAVDFGVPRPLQSVKLYFLDDGSEADAKVTVPARVELEGWDPAMGSWRPLSQSLEGQAIQGHRATVVRFPTTTLSKLRVTLRHSPRGKSGLTELEAWGEARLPLAEVPPPAGNLVFKPDGKGWPKASASFTDRFGGRPESAIDGKTVFQPTPMNRWTGYESRNSEDWLAVDFGRETEFRRVELAIYDDRGGVQAPEAYAIEYWGAEGRWKQAGHPAYSPSKPAGGQWNEVRFDPVKSARLRIRFLNKGKARSGVTEIQVWND
jgi:hypothetical protein